jgi:hypothetical protein
MQLYAKLTALLNVQMDPMHFRAGRESTKLVALHHGLNNQFSKTKRYHAA